MTDNVTRFRHSLGSRGPGTPRHSLRTLWLIPIGFALLVAGWRLQVYGLVEHPSEFSLADLHGLPYHEQITQHFCIRGWSGAAKWGEPPSEHAGLRHERSR